jgi:hypothetical protein
MTGHEFYIRRERHTHSGKIVYLYAHCSCGWESRVDDYPHETTIAIEARLRFLQHEIDVLVEGATSKD